MASADVLWPSLETESIWSLGCILIKGVFAAENTEVVLPKIA